MWQIVGGQRLVKRIGELMEAIAERAGLRNIRAVGERLKTAPGSAEGVGSDVLDVGRHLIGAMKGTTGDGDPDTGARFGHAHSAFGKAGETFHTAAPDDRWDGAASRAYAAQNTRQQLRAGTMADADLAVHRVLFREAAQITQRRLALEVQSNFLAYTSSVTRPLHFIPSWGAAAKLKVELNALQIALAESADQMSQLHSEVNANATELQQAVGRYRTVTDGADKPAPDADFQADRPQTAATVRFDASPGPPAGISPRGRK